MMIVSETCEVVGSMDMIIEIVLKIVEKLN